MNVEQMSTFFALLSLGAIALSVVGIAALVVVRRPDMRAQLQPLALPLAFLVAAVSTGGSLYYSEGPGFTPCEYCWYQRVAMYPLAPILLIAAWRRSADVIWYALPLSVVGVGISIYHYQLQQFPEQGSGCDASAPCTLKYVDEFGFVTIPFMALTGFIAITVLLIAAKAWADTAETPLTESDTDTDEQPTRPQVRPPATEKATVGGGA